MLSRLVPELVPMTSIWNAPAAAYGFAESVIVPVTLPVDAVVSAPTLAVTPAGRLPNDSASELAVIHEPVAVTVSAVWSFCSTSIVAGVTLKYVEYGVVGICEIVHVLLYELQSPVHGLPKASWKYTSRFSLVRATSDTLKPAYVARGSAVAADHVPPCAHCDWVSCEELQ